MPPPDDGGGIAVIVPGGGKPRSRSHGHSGHVSPMESRTARTSAATASGEKPLAPIRKEIGEKPIELLDDIDPYKATDCRTAYREAKGGYCLPNPSDHFLGNWPWLASAARKPAPSR